MKDFIFNILNTQHLLKERGLSDGGRVQQYVDSEVLRLNAPYLAHHEGEYRNSGTRGTVIGSGEVIYNTPKARFLYYGKVMVGEKSRSAWAHKGESKVVTGKNLTYRGGGLRGAFHFERMKVDHREDILKGAAKIAGGRYKK